MLYRMRIPNFPDLSTAGDVNFDVYIEKSIDGQNWELIENGHRTYQLQHDLIMKATNPNQILSYLEARILEEGLVQSDEAREKILSLIPGGQWPVDGFTREIDLPESESLAFGEK